MRFIHIADVHLGAVPDSGCPWSVFREKEIWKTFQKVIAYAGKEKADLLLIAGDLFHRQPLLREAREVNYLFSTIPDVQIVWMAGNHDYMRKDSAYRKVEWSPNVHGFFGQKPEVIHLPRIHTHVYGFSYENREILENPYRGMHPGGEPGCHILLGHGGDEKHIPFRAEDLAEFDYAALGHIHKPGVLSAGTGRRGELPLSESETAGVDLLSGGEAQEPRPDFFSAEKASGRGSFCAQAVYAGALEPIDRGDTGAHGLIDGEETNGRIQLRFLPVACRSYLERRVTVTEKTTQLKLERQIQKIIQQDGEHHIYRIQIGGFRSPDMDFDLESLYRLGNIAEIKDTSVPYYNLEALARQQEGTLIGEYLHCFDGQTGEIEQKALFYGLRALLKTEW